MIHLRSLEPEHYGVPNAQGVVEKPKRKYVLQRPKALPGKANYGERVLTLEQLHTLAESRKCVFCPHAHCFKMRNPAAWVMDLQALTVLRLIQSGMYEYVPAKPGKPPL